MAFFIHPILYQQIYGKRKTRAWIELFQLIASVGGFEYPYKGKHLLTRDLRSSLSQLEGGCPRVRQEEEKV